MFWWLVTLYCPFKLLLWYFYFFLSKPEGKLSIEKKCLFCWWIWRSHCTTKLTAFLSLWFGTAEQCLGKLLSEKARMEWCNPLQPCTPKCKELLKFSLYYLFIHLFFYFCVCVCLSCICGTQASLNQFLHCRSFFPGNSSLCYFGENWKINLLIIFFCPYKDTGRGEIFL